jgi:ribonucrease Y
MEKMTIPFFYSLLFAFTLTVTISLITFWLFKRWALKQAQQEAQEILQDAQSELDMILLDIQDKTSELEQQIFAQHKKEFDRLEESLQELESEIEDHNKNKDSQKEKSSSIYRKQQSFVDSFEHQIKEDLKDIENKKKNKLNLIESFRKKLQEKVQLNADEEILRLAEQEIQDWKDRFERWNKQEEIQLHNHLETQAKKIINRALNRFHRPYSSERGIPYVELDQERNQVIVQELKNPNNTIIKTISSLTGCDLFVDQENGYIAIGGFDPVRREFARRVTEKTLKEKNLPKEERIKQYSDTIKKELLSHIKRDGDLLAKELGLQNLHVEIRKMMGSLRYRYSFTQNQYFHCAEVGWLSGLLACEMGENTKSLQKARRAGLLHDLGKAMDHEFDGRTCCYWSPVH